MMKYTDLPYMGPETTEALLKTAMAGAYEGMPLDRMINSFITATDLRWLLAEKICFKARHEAYLVFLVKQMRRVAPMSQFAEAFHKVLDFAEAVAYNKPAATLNKLQDMEDQLLAAFAKNPTNDALEVMVTIVRVSKGLMIGAPKGELIQIGRLALAYAIDKHAITWISMFEALEPMAQPTTALLRKVG